MSDERTPQNPPPTPGSGGPPPSTTPGTPAAKEEVATDVSEVARARLAGTDKTQAPGAVAADAADAAKGVAGTPADDDTAKKVEAAPNATAPTAASTDGGSKTAPAATQPAGTGAPTKPAAAATPADGTPAASGGNGAAQPAPAAAPASSGGPVANPDTTAKAPTAADAAPPAAGAAAATAEAESKPGAPAAAARPAARPAAAKPGAKPAAPPKPPEPDPDEVTALRGLVPDLTWERRHGYLEVRVPSAQLIPVARAVKGLGYDYLSAVTAVDWRDRVEMLYHCYGWDYVETPGCMVIRADLPPEPNPLCPSLTAVWTGAELQEREIFDLFGVKFIGHPDLRRILLDDNFPGHPLRKDWTFDYEYVLVRHLKYGAEGQDAPPGGGEGFRRV